ncbi:IDEAL domain-containing protein [Scopulibacillus darangshiensis]|uniref:IDEAL domain-containing protein n=1 Tax=Scopulibacillus darangshiensis TaxID=442528 RepID=A0A4R2NY87_9BACL|nr:IDEAL domain-containing protein [Scopulibacillus darangshiensis]TCP27047.1 IDEAL domain-containing protein [Scopulibacillus darangshiensis]
MRNEPSYHNNAKSLAMLREKQPKVSVTEVYAQMMLDELVLNQRVKQLRVMIDESLDKKDKELFLSLSEEYRQLTR